MFCENCGRAVDSSANFCPNCGQSLRKGQTDAEEAVSSIEKTESIPLVSEPETSDTPLTESDTLPEVSDFSSEEIPEEVESSILADDSPTPESSTETMPEDELMAEDAITEESSQGEEVSPDPSLEADTPPPPSEEISAPGTGNRASENTLHHIDLAVAEGMRRDEPQHTQFETPPLYIPQPKRSKVLPAVITAITVVLVVVLVVVFVNQNFTLSSLFGVTTSPMVLTNRSQNLAYGMTQEAIEEELSAPIEQTEHGAYYTGNIRVVYRSNQAVSIALQSGASTNWKTSGKISLGSTRAEVFRAYNTDSLVSIMQAVGQLENSAEISQLNYYLVPYRFDEYGNLTQVTQLTKEEYETNAGDYFWLTIRINDDNLVDYLSIGDTQGTFEQK